jgi:methylmalonyl-CoA/ethylmalonyl-CoA epimerase
MNDSVSQLALNFFGDDVRFHHIGLVVKSIHAAVKQDAEIWRDDTQKVNVAFVDMHGAKVELIEPLGEDSPVSRAMRAGQKLLHLCFEAPELDAAVECGAAHGFRRIAQPVPATAFDQRRIVWLFSPVYGLIELVESGAIRVRRVSQ